MSAVGPYNEFRGSIHDARVVRVANTGVRRRWDFGTIRRHTSSVLTRKEQLENGE